MERRRLPVELEAYQQQCWIKDEDGKWEYTGFRCPCHKDQCCPLKKADGMDDDDALHTLRGMFELDHHDGRRFSKVKQTLAEDVTMICKDCHTQRHAHDPAASRLPRK